VVIFGFRAATHDHAEDPEEPAFVALQRRDNGTIEAQLAPTFAHTGWTVPKNYWVLDYGAEWSFYVRPSEWRPDVKVRTFDYSEAGTLLLDSQNRPGLMLSPVAINCYLSLKTWIVERPNTGKHVAARAWNISLPGVGDRREWPLGDAVISPPERLQSPAP
jgi:hypothetical protein